MAYLLLTGETGLVGGYLLRNFLQEEVRVAVLVRPSKHQTALERIEVGMDPLGTILVDVGPDGGLNIPSLPTLDAGIIACKRGRRRKEV